MTTTNAALPLSATALTLAGALLLVVAGVGHLRHPRRALAVLHAQRVLPERWREPVARALGPLEVLLGAAVLLSAGVAVDAAWRVASVLQGVLYAAFAVQTGVLVRTRPGVPCGCFGGDGAVSWAGAARAALLSGAACLAAVLPRAVVHGDDAGVLAVAAVLLAGVLVLGVELATLRS